MKHGTKPVINNAMTLAIKSENNVLITASYNGNHVLQKVILSKREFCPYLSDRSEKDSENNYQLNKRNQAKIVVQTHKKNIQSFKS